MGRKIEPPGPKESVWSQSQSLPSINPAESQVNDGSALNSRLPGEEQRYRTLIEQLPAILYVAEYGPEGPCYFVSPKIRELLGFEPEDWVGQTGFWMERMHPEDRARALAEEEEARRTGKNLRCEYRLQHRNGNYVWFRDEGVPLSTWPGGPPLLHGVLYDIQESKKTENALRQAEERFREVIERLPAAAYSTDFDPEMPWKYVSPQIETLLGVSQKTWLSRAGMWLAHVHPDDRELATAATAQIRLQGGPFRMEYRMVARNGRVLWVQDEGTVSSGPSGKPELINGILTEITERKKSEQDLRESEQRLRLALEASGMGAFDMDARTGFLNWDSRGGQLFEFPEHMKGRPFTELLYRIHPKDRPRIQTQVESALATGSTIQMEFRIVLDNGVEEWRAVHGRAVRDASGEIVRLVGIGQAISERKRAEEALRHSEERYRALYEDNVVALIIVTQDGRLVDCNQAFLQMHGYGSKSELQNIRAEELYANPQDRIKMLEALRVYGHLHNFETRHQRKDGSLFWAMRSITMLENPEGGAPLLLGTAVDISERKKAEEKLEESQDRLRHTLNSAPLVLFSLDAHGTFLLSEGQALQSLGLKPGQVVGQSIYDIYKDYPRILANFRRAISGEEFASIDQVTAPKELTFETSWMPLRNAQGEIVGATGVATDITERLHAEQARRAADERMRLALEGLGMGCWELDPTAGLVTWDEDLYAALQTNPATFSRKFSDFLAMVHPEDRPRILEELRRSEEEKRPYATEYRVILPDGEIQWRSSFARPAFDSQGKLLRFVGVNQDITKRRKLEEQLLLAQKMEAIGKLAGGVAHDFNNLLTVIRGHAEILQQRAAVDAAVLRDAEAIQMASDRAASITQQLLAFSRKQVLQPRLIELRHVVQDIATLLQRLLGSLVELHLELAPVPLWVRADESQLEQVVLNLVINARDAMPQGGTITVRLDRAGGDSPIVKRHAQMPSANFVRLCVRDTGTGMDTATQARIFEPFFTTKELGKGTGLGLATVYGIVKQSGGWIWVDSAPGAGATFEVFLPEVAAPEQEGTGSHREPEELSGSETILFADDEEAIRELAAQALRQKGYRVLTAESGTQALELALRETAPIHVLITDAFMPGMGGPELATRLRETRPDTRILYISGYAEDAGVLQEALKGGGSFLQKPFTLEQLARKLRRLLSDDLTTDKKT